MKTFFSELLSAGAILAGALVFASALAAVCGYDPAAALKALAVGAFSWPYGVDSTLNSTIPLLFTGLAVAVAFRGGALNIGAEGQYLGGALAAIGVGVACPSMPFPWLLIVATAAGALAGAAVAAVAGLLRAARDIPEVLSTIMLNFVMIFIVSLFVQGPLMEAGYGLPQSPPMPEAGVWPALGLQYEAHAGLGLALAAVVACAFLISRTTFGFRLRAVGANPEAARHAGISVRRTILETMAVSGALAGLGGAVELCGVTHRLYENFGSGYGYTGIAVAMLGRLRPAGVLLAALFFGALDAGSGEMQRSAGIPSVVVFVIQGVVILFAVTRGAMGKEGGDWRRWKKPGAEAAPSSLGNADGE